MSQPNGKNAGAAGFDLDSSASSKVPTPMLPIKRDRLRPVQEVSTRHRLIVQDEAEYLALLAGNSAKWSLVGSQVAGGDTIEVCDDFSTIFALWYVRLAIQAPAGGVSVVDVSEIFRQDLGVAADQETVTGEWCVQYRGPHLKWCVLRPDGTILRQGMNSREEARLHLNTVHPHARNDFKVVY